jgi:hypothetical protein
MQDITIKVPQTDNKIVAPQKFKDAIADALKAKQNLLDGFKKNVGIVRETELKNKYVQSMAELAFAFIDLEAFDKRDIICYMYEDELTELNTRV